MEIKDGRLVARVRLAGRRFEVFEDALLDTGAGFTVIPPETADFLELPTHEELPKVGLVTASGLIEAAVKVLEKLEMGDISIDKLPVVIHQIPDPAPIKILLGMNFVEAIKLTVNGKEGVFEIEDP